MDVYAEADPAVEDGDPVSVGAGINIGLLKQDLLDFVQVVNIGVGHCGIHALVELLDGFLCLLGIEHGVAGDDQEGLRTIGLHLAIGACMVGSGESLANLAVVGHVEQPGGDVVEHVVGKGVFHGIGAPDFIGLSLWVLHLLVKLVGYKALGEGAHLLARQVGLAFGGQRGDVLLDELLQGSLVVVAHEGEGEVGGIAVEDAGHLQHAVVTDSVEGFWCRGAEERVVLVDDAIHGVLEDGIVVVADVAQNHFQGVDERVHCFLVLCQVGETDVGELHQRLQVLGGG